LIIGTGKGGPLSVYRNDAHGGFKRLSEAPFGTPVLRDQTGIVFWREEGKPGSILAGSANYEEGSSTPSRVQQYDLARKTLDETLTNQESSIGPLALTDMDGDGNLDLFVGGRVIPGRYPEVASSRIYRRHQAAW